jgi:hypothetical protein
MADYLNPKPVMSPDPVTTFAPDPRGIEFRSEAMRAVAEERERQIALGHDSDHDDEHEDGAIGTAAECYLHAANQLGRHAMTLQAMVAYLATLGATEEHHEVVGRMKSDPLGYIYGRGENGMLSLPYTLVWPWEPEAWRPSEDRIRNLIKAAALIVAEVERLQRRLDLTGSYD